MLPFRLTSGEPAWLMALFATGVAGLAVVAYLIVLRDYAPNVPNCCLADRY